MITSGALIAIAGLDEMTNDKLIELMKNPNLADEAFAVFLERGKVQKRIGGTWGFKISDLIEIIKDCPHVRVGAFELLATEEFESPLTFDVLERGMIFSYVPYFSKREEGVKQEFWDLILKKVFKPEQSSKGISDVIKDLGKIKNYPDFWGKAKNIFLEGSERILTEDSKDFTDEFYSDTHLLEITNLLLKISEDAGKEFFEIILNWRKDDLDELALTKTLIRFQEIPYLKGKCRFELVKMKPRVWRFVEIMECHPEMQDECLGAILAIFRQNPETIEKEHIMALLSIKAKTPGFIEFQKTFEKPCQGILTIFRRKWQQ
jgi:hypothetical protein